jgi:hypothetical protein
MDISIRSIQPHELSALLNLYKYLNPIDDPLPDESTLQQIWNQILSDRKINCFVANLDGNLIASCTLVVGHRRGKNVETRYIASVPTISGDAYLISRNV